MKNKVKALLINPETETVTEIELEHKNMLLELYKTIGCDCVEAVRNALLMNGMLKIDDVWIDEEGLLKEQKHYWTLPYYNQLIAGKAVIMGVDDEGECIDHTFTKVERQLLEKQLVWHHVDTP